MKTPLPPTTGYGAPYKGTGEQIFVKDSRTDWDITEGKNNKLTSEQALEAAGDPEYERRRQLMKAHNEKLYVVGKEHRSTAKKMLLASLGLIVVGWIGGTIGAHATKSETLTPGDMMMPDMRVIEPSGASALFVGVGTIMVLSGFAGIAYGLYGSVKKPPYYHWRVPRAMDRPAYIRQQVEPYNEKLTPANPIPKKGPPGMGGPPGPRGPGAGRPPPNPNARPQKLPERGGRR